MSIISNTCFFTLLQLDYLGMYFVIRYQKILTYRVIQEKNASIIHLSI